MPLYSLAFLAMAIFSMALPAMGQTTAAVAPASPAAPDAFSMASLRPALANVQATIANIGVARWKTSATSRTTTQQDVSSMQRDLNATLPGLMAQAEAAATNGSAPLAPSFAVFRNLDALYDVLLRVTETAQLSGSEADAASLEDARAGLEESRGKLGNWLLQSITAQDTQVSRVQAAPARPSTPSQGPTKVVVNDGPSDTTKPHKKKPVQTPQ